MPYKLINYSLSRLNIYNACKIEHMKIFKKHLKMKKLSILFSILISIIVILVSYLVYKSVNKQTQEVNSKVVEKVIAKRKSDEMGLQKWSYELDNPRAGSNIQTYTKEKKIWWLEFYAQGEIAQIADEYVQVSSIRQRKKHYPNCADLQAMMKDTKVSIIKEGVCKIQASADNTKLELYYGYNNDQIGELKEKDPCFEVSIKHTRENSYDILLEYLNYDQDDRINPSPTLFSNSCIQN